MAIVVQAKLCVKWSPEQIRVHLATTFPDRVWIVAVLLAGADEAGLDAHPIVADVSVGSQHLWRQGTKHQGAFDLTRRGQGRLIENTNRDPEPLKPHGPPGQLPCARGRSTNSCDAAHPRRHCRTALAFSRWSPSVLGSNIGSVHFLAQRTRLRIG